SRRRHTRSKRDWSSDVCSSDLGFLLNDNQSHGNLDTSSVPWSIKDLPTCLDLTCWLAQFLHQLHRDLKELPMLQMLDDEDSLYLRDTLQLDQQLLQQFHVHLAWINS